MNPSPPRRPWPLQPPPPGRAALAQLTLFDDDDDGPDEADAPGMAFKSASRSAPGSAPGSTPTCEPSKEPVGRPPTDPAIDLISDPASAPATDPVDAPPRRAAGDVGARPPAPLGAAASVASPASRALPATPGPPQPLADPPDLAPALHPAVWRAHQLGRASAAVQPSGFEALDAELPGGGWPHGVLTELLLPHPGVGELRLLAPALARLQAAGRVLLWFDPPAAPCAQALQWLGLQLPRLVLVRRRDGLGPRHPAGLRDRLPAADTLWALEQALHSGHAGAVLAWLPARLPADVLRRLQLAAQAHDGPAFVLRDTALAAQPSPAPLRLALSADGPDRLRVRLLKRRGPPVPAPLVLDLPPVLPATVAARWAGPSPARPAVSRSLPVRHAASAPGGARGAGGDIAGDIASSGC